MANSKKAMNLKNVPVDVVEYLLQKQLLFKLNKKTNQYSLEKTIYKLLREHRDQLASL